MNIKSTRKLRRCGISARAGLSLALASGFWLATGTAGAQIEVDIVTTATESATTATESGTTAPVATAQQTPSPDVVAPLSQDKAADEAARRILPAPGTVFSSTENSILNTAPATAAAPSVQMTSAGVTLQNGQTTEALAVKSGVELLRMLGLQKKDNITTGELEADEQAIGLFDVSAVKRLKGEDPTVVYRVVISDTPLPDPMIVPWIRQAKMLQERFDRAVAMLGNNQVIEGRQEMLAIVSDFPASDYAAQAREILKKLEDLEKSNEAPAPVIVTDTETTKAVAIQLSPDVKIGTVIVEPSNPADNRAMIGARPYKAGDMIKGIPNHKVVSISESVVQVEVEESGQKQTFDVPVRPSGGN